LYTISVKKYSDNFLRAVNYLIDQIDKQNAAGMEGDDFFENVAREINTIVGEDNYQEAYITKNQEDVLGVDGYYLLIDEE
jgi:hypothetical protein